MARADRDTGAHRAIAFGGWVFIGVGLLGLGLWPRAFIVWVALIAFGVAALPRALIEWWRDRRRGRQEPPGH